METANGLGLYVHHVRPDKDGRLTVQLTSGRSNRAAQFFSRSEVVTKVLIACEYSGAVREAFRKRGHEATSCDLLDTEIPGPHYKGNVLDIIANGWDLMIAHPPCTYLCSSGLHWNKRTPGRAALTTEALEFVRRLLAAPIARIALENPVGCISTQIRKYDQVLQPYEFGDDASKKTCIWLKGLKRLTPTKRVPGRIVTYYGKTVERWANQTDSGQNKLGPSETRGLERSRTYQGIANAMASQWGQENI